VINITGEEWEIIYYQASVCGICTSLFLSLLSIAINIGGFILNNNKQKKFESNMKKEQINHELKVNRLECSRDFKSVTSKKEIFINFISDEINDLKETSDNMDNILKETIVSNNNKILRKAFNLCTSLYNELEGFCGKILDKTYDCDEYIEKELKNDIYFLIMKQPEFYQAIYTNYKDYKIDNFVNPQFYNQTNLKEFIEKYYKNNLDDFVNSRENIKG